MPQARAPLAAAALAAATLLVAFLCAPGVQAARWDYFQQRGNNGTGQAPNPAPELGASERAGPQLPPPAPERPAAPSPRPTSIAAAAPASEALPSSRPAPGAAGSPASPPAAELNTENACACTATGMSGGANTSGEAKEFGRLMMGPGVLTLKPSCLPACLLSMSKVARLLSMPLRSCWVRPVAAAAGQQHVDLLHPRASAVHPGSRTHG